MGIKAWITEIKFDKELLDKISKICRDISEKDKSFVYRIKNLITGQHDYVLMIKSDTRTQAHKRGLLLAKKYTDIGKYNVKELPKGWEI